MASIHGWEEGREGGNDGDDDNDGIEKESDFNSMTDRIVFLIDGREAMMSAQVRKGEDEMESQLMHSLRFAVSIMKRKIIQDNSCVGVVLVGATTSSSEGVVSGRLGINVLCPLEPPTAASIRKLEDLLLDPDVFVPDFGSDDVDSTLFPLKEAILDCSQIFKKDVGKSKVRKASVTSRLWLFTNDDDPFRLYPSRKESMKNQVITTCGDAVKANGLDLTLWALNREEGSDFSLSKFYKEILEEFVQTTEEDLDNDETGGYDNEVNEYTADEALAERIERGDGINGFDLSKANIRRKNFKKRILSRASWSFGQTAEGLDISLALKLFKTVQIATKPYSAAWLDATDNTMLVSKTSIVEAKTGIRVEAQEKSQAIGSFLEVDKNVLPVDKNLFQIIRAMGHVKAATFGSEPSSTLVVSSHSNSNSNSNSSSSSSNNSSSSIVTISDNNKVAVPIPTSGKALPNVGSIKTLFMTPLENISPGRGHNIGSPIFLFPDEASIIGSMEVYKMLMDDLWSKRLAAIVTFQRNRSLSSVPIVAAIFAERSSYLDGDVSDGDEGGAIGLYLMPIPYAEDVRRSVAKEDNGDGGGAMKDGDDGENADENVETVRSLMKQAISSMSNQEQPLNYSSQINNPLLQLFYSTLQAVAIQGAQQWDESTGDSMVVRESIKSSTDAESWMEIQQRMGLDPESLEAEKGISSTGKKRGGAAGGGEKAEPKKRAKKEKGEDGGDNDGGALTDINDLDIGDLPHQTLANLKDLCRQFSLPVSGTKDVLIGRLADFKNS